MMAVIFEVMPSSGRKQKYLDTAADLRPILEQIEGFVSVERFQSLTDPEKMLSLSIFENEAALVAWRNTEEHRLAQAQGRSGTFSDYRLKIATVVRDYGMKNRDQAPIDSRARHG